MIEVGPFALAMLSFGLALVVATLFFVLRERSILRRLDSVEAKSKASDELYQTRLKALASFEEARRQDVVDLRERVTLQEEKISHLNADLLSAYQQNAVLNGQLLENTRLRERLAEERDEHRKQVDALKSSLNSKAAEAQSFKISVRERLEEMQKVLALGVKYERLIYDGFFFEDGDEKGKERFLQLRDAQLPGLIRELDESQP